MKQRPILFSKPMVQAILDGSKTQTRRIIKPQPFIDEMGNFCWNGRNFGQDFKGPHVQAIASPIPSSSTNRVHCPYGHQGDQLWVRETWQYADWTEDGYPFIRFEADRSMHLCERIPTEWDERLENTWLQLSTDDNYKVDGRAADRRWRPSIHMPRWASRIDLEITCVRVERLQDISEADAIAEGIESAFEGSRWRMYDHCDGEEHSKYVGPRWTIDPVRSFKSLWLSINGAGSWDENPWVWVVEFRRIKP